MKENNSYTELNTWKEARVLVKHVYFQVNSFPQNEQYGITSQIKRSAISIPSNIAEGVGRNTTKDTLKFFYISRGSLYELETQLYLSFDLNFITELELNELLKQVVIVKKLLAGFINHYKKKL
ncbi:MAG: four helix bundle protein [Flavobacteriales bacterium]|jgi:four helix bundle protein|nr:four helix bundle protein [Flavobacteriales bacterium]MCB9364331.1 four helix bundle protein [Flavobacteriales bacterium]